jgi:peptidylprolyl isomerase
MVLGVVYHPRTLTQTTSVNGEQVNLPNGGAFQPHRPGKEFDASWNRGSTFDFRLGAREVIEGWDQGVKGMKVGGRRRLTIPPDMGYGDRGAGGVIRGGETLVFVVDLVAVR